VLLSGGDVDAKEDGGGPAVSETPPPSSGGALPDAQTLLIDPAAAATFAFCQRSAEAAAGAGHASSGAAEPAPDRLVQARGVPPQPTLPVTTCCYLSLPGLPVSKFAS
jgi:hypothetical protein